MANTELRCAGSATALSQLSMIAYSPTSSSPCSMRSTIHTPYTGASACTSTTIATSAVQNANVRMCPMRCVSRGTVYVPSRKPA